ncbi:hypothetical protein VB773_09200 [Haloarculaceae archaeon H-GB2-1]|nr:hypothetical protein [Haloarculaceae archaeon H-GB1-1]MEA5386225.1 hypothetical protein [Haloarculaceae archaeon H-GB11]MEA5407726.1 hypothetical protein [Haloarculaceae archaeon H-GB2-1]
MTGEQGIVSAIRFDLRRLHDTWMELVYPRQRNTENTVLGKWQPEGLVSTAGYRLWSAVGVPLISLAYPLALFGVIVRFQARRLDSTAARLGVIGTVLLATLLWGGLTALARFKLNLAPGGVLAVGAASAVAVVSAALAVTFRSVGGRVTTVLLSYPFAMTALFLPPVVAALYSRDFAAVVFPRSDWLARWLLDNVLDVAGISRYLVRNFERQGLAYAGMWFGIAVPVGWVLGVLVTLADFVKPE